MISGVGSATVVVAYDPGHLLPLEALRYRKLNGYGEASDGVLNVLNPPDFLRLVRHGLNEDPIGDPGRPERVQMNTMSRKGLVEYDIGDGPGGQGTAQRMTREINLRFGGET